MRLWDQSSSSSLPIHWHFMRFYGALGSRPMIPGVLSLGRWILCILFTSDVCLDYVTKNCHTEKIQVHQYCVVHRNWVWFGAWKNRCPMWDMRKSILPNTRGWISNGATDTFRLHKRNGTRARLWPTPCLGFTIKSVVRVSSRIRSKVVCFVVFRSERGHRSKWRSENRWLANDLQSELTYTYHLIMISLAWLSETALN